jgi:hypothetical protein
MMFRISVSVPSARRQWVMSACQTSLGRSASNRRHDERGRLWGCAVMNLRWASTRQMVAIDGQLPVRLLRCRRWFRRRRRVRRRRVPYGGRRSDPRPAFDNTCCDHDPGHRHRPHPPPSGCKRCRETPVNYVVNSDAVGLPRPAAACCDPILVDVDVSTGECLSISGRNCRTPWAGMKVSSDAAGGEV